MTDIKAVGYLAGPIANQTDSQANDWRNDLTVILKCNGFEVNNPMKRDFRGIEGDHTKEIVEGDLNDIDVSDFVIAYCPFPSVGTSMEIMYTYFTSNMILPIKPCFVVVPSDVSVSPWIKYYATKVFDNFDDAVWQVLDTFS